MNLKQLVRIFLLVMAIPCLGGFVYTDFKPDADSTIDLGTTDLRFAEAWIDTVTVTGLMTSNKVLATDGGSAAVPGLALGMDDTGLYRDDSGGNVKIGIALSGFRLFEHNQNDNTFTMELGSTDTVFSQGGIAVTGGNLTLSASDGTIFVSDERLTGTGDWDTTGDLNIGVGGTVLDVDSTLETVGICSAATAAAHLTLSPVSSQSDSFNILFSSPNIQPTVAAKSYGGLSLNFTLTGNDVDSIGVTSLTGISSTLALDNNNLGGSTRYRGTIDVARGFVTTGTFPAGGPDKQFITEYRHFEAQDPLALNGVNISNMYGLFIEDMTQGEGQNWSIYSGSAPSSFAGNVRIGDNTVPTFALEVAGDIQTDGLNFTSATELTISSGAVTVTKGHHSIDTEGDATDDDLDTINGGDAGEILFILPANDDRTVRIRHGVGNIYLKHQTASQSYNFNSPQGASGIFYKAGFYDFPTTDANLDQAGTTQTEGDANGTHAAHASLIAGGAGTATGGSGAVTIVVTGTSINDSGTRVGSDSEVIVADITAMSTDEYFETSKKWLGTITYTLTVGATGHTAYAADFNYGLSKYEDIGNTNYSITFFECVGRAGANDTGFNIRLIHHNSADWTYAATGFVPGPSIGDASELANMNTTHSTESVLNNADPFAYKRDDLNQDVAGDNGEGIIIEITTTANRAVESMDIHIGVHSAPKFGYMATTKQHLIFMKHGPNWLEL